GRCWCCRRLGGGRRRLGRRRGGCGRRRGRRCGRGRCGCVAAATPGGSRRRARQDEEQGGCPCGQKGNQPRDPAALLAYTHPCCRRLRSTCAFEMRRAVGTPRRAPGESRLSSTGEGARQTPDLRFCDAERGVGTVLEWPRSGTAPTL